MSMGAALDRHGADSYTAADLVSMAAAGELRVPTFQRQYVWDAKDVRNLFDSILRGFPIGTLLLWKRPGLAGEVDLGPIRLTVPAVPNALWVVDGQQRVTSLFGALAPDQQGVDERFDVYFDFATQRFVNARRGYRPPRAIPVREVLESRSLLTWLRHHSDDLEAEDLDTADRLGGALRDYKIPVYVVVGDDQNLLREVFDRVNSAGKPISRAQVFHALFATEGEPGSPASVVAALRTKGFGTIDESRIVQSVLAIRGGDVQRDLHDEFAQDEDPGEWFDNAEAALARTVSFLRANGVPHLSLMPNTLAIPALAAFFHLHPEPEPWTLRLLSRWVWRGWVHGFGREGGQTPVLRRAIQSVHPEHRHPEKAPAEFDAVKSLLEFISDRAAPEIRLTGFNARFGDQRLLLLALSSLGPLSLEGEPLDLGQEFEEHGADTVGEFVAGHRTNAGARGFWPRQTRFDLSLATEAVRRSHLIGDNAAGALAQGDVAGFLASRGAALSSLARDFLNARLEPGAPIRPSLRALLERGADGVDEG